MLKLNKNISIDARPVFDTTNDVADILDKTKNVWNNIFLELFKYMLSNFPDPNECLAIIRGTDLTLKDKFHNTEIAGLVSHLESIRAGYINDKFRDVFEHSDSHKDSGLDDSAEYDMNMIVGRVFNPTVFDLIPKVVISTKIFMGLDTDIDIPLMCVIPSIEPIYNSYYTLHAKYYKEEIKPTTNDFNNSMLDVSILSILLDFDKIYKEFDVETKTISEYGKSILMEVISKYVDISLPLIMMSIRKDYDRGNDFVNMIFTQFTNSYQSALVAQKYMYAIIHDFIYSKMGRDVIRIFTYKYATSTYDLLNPNSSNMSQMIEQISNATGNCDITRYKYHLESINIISQIYKDANEQREALGRVSIKLINIILSILSESISLDGLTVMNEKLMTSLCAYINSIGNIICDTYSQLPRDMQNLKNSCNINTITQLTKTVAKSQAIIPNTVNPGVRSNHAQFTPIAQKILSGNEIRQYNFIGSNGTANESFNLLKDIVQNKTSNAAMRMISVECEKLDNPIDAQHILIESKWFREAANAQNKLAVSNEDTKQFVTFMNNVEKEVLRQKF